MTMAMNTNMTMSMTKTWYLFVPGHGAVDYPGLALSYTGGEAVVRSRLTWSLSPVQSFLLHHLEVLKRCGDLDVTV